MGQPKMKHWKLHELHKNEVKKCASHMSKNVEILNFEQLLKDILRVFPSLGGGGVNSILWQASQARTPLLHNSVVYVVPTPTATAMVFVHVRMCGSPV